MNKYDILNLNSNFLHIHSVCVCGKQRKHNFQVHRNTRVSIKLINIISVDFWLRWNASLVQIVNKTNKSSMCNLTHWSFKMHRMTFWVIVLRHINTQFPSCSFSGCLGRWKPGHAQARFSFLASPGLPVLTRWACTRAVDKITFKQMRKNCKKKFLKRLENSVDICSVWKLLICCSTRTRAKMFPVILNSIFCKYSQLKLNYSRYLLTF